MSSLSVSLRDPVIRASMLTIFFFGFAGAAVQPYQSVIGITELGLSDNLYSLLILLASVVNVVVSVSIGVVADKVGEYRLLMRGIIVFGIVGFGMVYLLPTAASFVVSALVFLPVHGALNSLLFANVRTATRRMASEDAAAVNSVVRAVISLSWVLVPGLVAFVLVGSPTMLPAYLIASLACILSFVIVQCLLPARTAGDPLLVQRYTYLASFGEVLSPRVSVRLLALSAMCSMLFVNGAVLPLILTGAAGGKVTDIGVVVGIVAALEVVFILVWGRILRHIHHVTALVIGAALYAVYLVLLGFASAPWHVYALSLISGFGAAALISIPITYLQDLIAERPGLGSSLISVNMFLSGGLCAALFALGAHISDYSGTAMLGGGAGVIGLVMLLVLDRDRIRAGQTPD